MSATNTSAKVLQFPHGRRRSIATIDRAWREACVAYLFACFNGAPSARLQQLASVVFFARAALLKRQSGQVASVPRLSRAGSSRARKSAVKSPSSPLFTGRK